MSRTARSTSIRLRLTALLAATATVSAIVGTAVVLGDPGVSRVDLVAQAAANRGTPVIAGKVTKSRKLTTLQRTKNGPALRLRTKASSPPLKVTSTKKVAKLNVDQVDGLDAEALETRTFVYRLPSGGTPASTQQAVFPNLPEGTYLMNYALTLEGEAPISSGTCFLSQSGALDVIGLAYVATRGSFATASSSGSIDTAEGTIELRCVTSVAAKFDNTDGSNEVTFTRTDVVETDASPLVARPSKSSGGSTASAN